MTDSAAINIAGVVRNGGQALLETLERVDRLRARLSASRVVVATNDNTDKTDQALNDYATARQGVEVLRMDGLCNQYSERVDRIAYARNCVLDQIFGHGSCHPFTLFLDLDGPNVKLSPDEVLKAAKRNDRPWAGIFANPVPAYYDLYALRCPGWCDEDVWEYIGSQRKPLFFRRRKRQRLIHEAIFKRQYSIPTHAPLIPVISAFAGLGLYKSRFLDSLKYSSRRSDGSVVCEHVLLNEQILANGGKLFIDPALTTSAPSEHLGVGSGAPFPERLFADVKMQG